jgi:hypothetical protein
MTPIADKDGRPVRLSCDLPHDIDAERRIARQAEHEEHLRRPRRDLSDQVAEHRSEGPMQAGTTGQNPATSSWSRDRRSRTSVVSGLRTHMMGPALLKIFASVHREVNRLRMERSAGLAAQRKELDHG